MTEKQFAAIVTKQLNYCKELLKSKSAEYTTNSDRLMNIRLSAELQQVSLKQALAGQMAKHTVSIAEMIHNNRKYSIEVWTEKITDHINYLLLLKAVVEEEHEANVHFSEDNF